MLQMGYLLDLAITDSKLGSGLASVGKTFTLKSLCALSFEIAREIEVAAINIIRIK